MSRGPDRWLANNGNPFYFRPPWDSTENDYPPPWNGTDSEYTSESPYVSSPTRPFSMPNFSTTRSPSPAASNRTFGFSPSPARVGSESYPSTAVTSETPPTQPSTPSPPPIRLPGLFGLPNPFTSESDIPRRSQNTPPQPTYQESYAHAIDNQRQWLEEDRNLHRSAANGLQFTRTDWNVNGRPPGFEQMYRAAANAATNHPDYNEIMAQQLAAASAYTPTFNTQWPPFSAFGHNRANDRN